MPSKNPTIQSAYKSGMITKGQYDKLSEPLLLAIIKKKKSTKSPKVSRNKVSASKGKGKK
jgi:hypothetical protein